MSCVIDYSKKPAVLLCTICKGTAPLSLPITIDQMVALTKQFEKQHEGCSQSARQFDKHGETR